MKAVRAAVHSEERDRAVLKQAKSSPFWKRESFFVYVSFSDEAGTEELISALLAAGKRVCLPLIEDGVMLAAPYTKKRRKNRYGIEEPLSHGDEPCEVVFAPLLAADGSGNRLGYGGGYYDRYFKSHPNALRVGLCYEAQLLGGVPVEPDDCLLHAVVTEAGVHYFNVPIA